MEVPEESFSLQSSHSPTSLHHVRYLLLHHLHHRLARVAVSILLNARCLPTCLQSIRVPVRMCSAPANPYGEAGPIRLAVHMKRAGTTSTTD